MLIEASGDYPSTWSAIQAIASKIGCTPQTLRSWYKKHIEQIIPASVQAQSQEQRITITSMALRTSRISLSEHSENIMVLIKSISIYF